MVKTVYGVEDIFDLVGGEVVIVHSLNDEAEHDAIPQIQYTLVIALVGQFLQVVITKQVFHFLIKPILLQELLEICIIGSLPYTSPLRV